MSRPQAVWQLVRRTQSFTRAVVQQHYIHSPGPEIRYPLNEDFNNNSKREPLNLLGHGRPIDEVYHNYGPNEYIWNTNQTSEGFSHGFSSWIQSRRNLVREIHMIRVMDALTDKEGWNAKVFDEVILARWKAEAMNLPGRLIGEMAWSWIVKELRCKAAGHSRTGYMTTLETCSTIVKADALIEEDTRRDFQAAVKLLMKTSGEEKDWHPGSDQKVLNLVHPSLYSLVYGRTRVLSDRLLDVDSCLLGMPEDGVTINVPETPELQDYDNKGFRDRRRFPYPELWSTKFQWLPCDVEFTGSSGDEVQIVSYINNLHPAKHQDLYHLIEKIITKSIQPWNEVLRWDDFDEGLLRIRHTDEIHMDPHPETADSIMGDFLSDMENLEDEDVEAREILLDEIKKYLAQPDNPDHIPISRTWEHPREPFDGSFEGRWWKHNRGLVDELYAKQERTRITFHPEPGVDKTYEDWQEARNQRLRPKIEEMFRERGLQVIVKLASIELTPDNPKYDGGKWHLEGKMNEHIVATSIYYYDVENITESRIQFRQEAQLDNMDDVEYSSTGHGPIEDAYGARGLNYCAAIQETGSIVTRQNRLLVFPNIVQHRVEPFELKDPTKPGHRRFLVLWLVDPHYRVISTRNVAPQQSSWWKDAQCSNTRDGGSDTKGDSINGPMQQTEAERYRLELMKERTTVMDGVESHYERYNFCEH